jgi:hypothetical protein
MDNYESKSVHILTFSVISTPYLVQMQEVVLRMKHRVDGRTGGYDVPKRCSLFCVLYFKYLMNCK